MHHWEYDPQDMTVRVCALRLSATTHALLQYMMKGAMGPLFLALFDAYEYSTGLIIASPEVYEPAAIAAIKDWYGELGRKVWSVGPLLPSSSRKEAIAGEEAQSANFSEIKQFMNKVLSSHGERSMLYVSAVE